jgi:hypothetical protein
MLLAAKTEISIKLLDNGARGLQNEVSTCVFLRISPEVKVLYKIAILFAMADEDEEKKGGLYTIKGHPVPVEKMSLHRLAEIADEEGINFEINSDNPGKGGVTATPKLFVVVPPKKK